MASRFEISQQKTYNTLKNKGISVSPLVFSLIIGTLLHFFYAKDVDSVLEQVMMFLIYTP